MSDFVRETVGKKPSEIEALKGENESLRNQLRLAKERAGRAEETIGHLENKVTLLKSLATKDELTGVLNRRGLNEELQRLIAHSRRFGEPMCLVMVDLDNLKMVNDTFGHDVGDVVLIGIAGVLEHGIRIDDVVSRWGGDEFMVILPRTLINKANEIAERIRQKIQMEVAKKIELDTEITVSIGISSLEKDDTQESLQKKADLAAYKAKNLGKNQTVVWQESFSN